MGEGSGAQTEGGAIVIPCDAGATDYPEEDGFEDEGPYCTCDLEPTEEEEMSNTCDSCGKLLT